MHVLQEGYILLNFELSVRGFVRGSQRVDKNTPIIVMRRRGKTTSGAGNFSGGGGKLRGSLPPPPPPPILN